MTGNVLLRLFLTVCFVCSSILPVWAVEKVYVDLTKEHQTMDGTAANIYSHALNQDENVMKLITEDMNLTHAMVRTWLTDYFGENGWEPINDNGDPNTINWQGFKDEGDVHLDLLMMQTLSKAGIQPTLGIFDVPDWMVTNPNASEKRHVPPSMYPEFAEWVVSFLLYAKSHYNVDINIIEIQNEPNIGWRVYYTPTELADISEVVLQALADYDLGHVKMHIGNVNKATDAIQYWAPSFSRPFVVEGTVAAAYHAWEGMTQGVVESLRKFCHDNNVKCWATEVGSETSYSYTWKNAMAAMKRYHQVFTWSNASLTFHWALAGAQSAISPEGHPYPVYNLLKHYYQHIKPGSIRVDTDDKSGTFSTAFLNKFDKTLSIVTINQNYNRNGRYILFTPPGVYFSKVTVFMSELNGIEYENVGEVDVINGQFDYFLTKDAYYTFVGTYKNKILPYQLPPTFKK